MFSSGKLTWGFVGDLRSSKTLSSLYDNVNPVVSALDQRVLLKKSKKCSGTHITQKVANKAQATHF